MRVGAINRPLIQGAIRQQTKTSFAEPSSPQPYTPNEENTDGVKVVGPGELPAILEKTVLPSQLGAFEIINRDLGTIGYKNLAALKARANRIRENGTTLIAVRHAESEANAGGTTLSGRGETPLTEKGEQQAAESAVSLANRGLNEQDVVIYSSPLGRAEDTAKVLQEKLSLPGLEIDDDLCEIDFGKCEGREVSEVIQAYPGFAGGTDFVHRFPDGESGIDVMTRVDRFLNRVENENAGQTVVFYGHTMTLAVARILLGLCEETKDGAIFAERRIPNAIAQTMVEPELSDDSYKLV